MDSSVSRKEEIWFLRVCHHVPHELYNPGLIIIKGQKFDPGTWTGPTYMA